VLLRDLGLTESELAARTAARRAADAAIIVPSHNGNPMAVGATQWKEQPDFRKPAPNPSGTITKRNPLGA